LTTRKYKRIGIIGAMKEEIEPFFSCFENIKTTNYANNNYYETTYNGYELVIAYSKIGKIFSTLTASCMCQKFDVDLVIFTGVAGAINKDLNIGDLLVATKLVQHDLDITAFGHPHGYVPEGKVFVETTDFLRTLVHKIAKDNDIVISDAIIATGDQFVHDNSRKEFIEKTFDADALEMEGASVAVVCDAFDIPFVILRAISDTANTDASFDFEKFLINSAKQSSSFVVNILDNLE
jgi:adenosylhomocysteine/aminodeoxyfutalosine nucleosidase